MVENYFNDYQNNIDFSILISASQFVHNYNTDKKQIEIIKDGFKNQPDEYERKFKAVRNAIAHCSFEIRKDDVYIEQYAPKQKQNIFEMRMSKEAFIDFVTILTEKRILYGQRVTFLSPLRKTADKIVYKLNMISEENPTQNENFNKHIRRNKK